ncbi:MAG: undecaprenyl-diphosphate phosphatase [Candidatus Omnitrophota bacterium]
MTIREALISGVVQGITEFLPVSSSGHLVLVHNFFGFTEPNMFFDICLHVATLMVVIIYFGRDIYSLIRDKNIFLLKCVTVGTVPAVIAGAFFSKQISSFFLTPRRVAFMLILTGLTLFAGQIMLNKKGHLGKSPTIKSSILTGLAQAFALFPGISRSGLTISIGLFSGMKAEEAFRFSFLLFIPAITGAMIYKISTGDVGGLVLNNLTNYATGMIAAFITGFFSLHFLWKAVKFKRLFIFAIYCFSVGIIGMLFLR